MSHLRCVTRCFLLEENTPLVAVMDPPLVAVMDPPLVAVPAAEAEAYCGLERNTM
jgi:hypothetical protein